MSSGSPLVARRRAVPENLPRMGMSAMAVNPHTSELYRGSAFGTWIDPAPGQ